MPLYNPAGASTAAAVGLIKPVYISGNWYDTVGEWGFSPATTSSPTNTVARFIPCNFYGPATISSLGVRTGGTASGNCEIAVYAHSNTTGRPTGLPLITTGQIVTTSINTAVNSGAISLAITTPQVLWFGIMSDNGTVVYNGNSVNALPGLFGSATQNNLHQNGSLMSLGAPLTYSTTPATTWIDLTAYGSFTEAVGVVPNIQFKIA